MNDKSFIDDLDTILSDIVLKFSEGINYLESAYTSYVISEFTGKQLVLDEYVIEIMQEMIKKAEVKR